MFVPNTQKYPKNIFTSKFISLKFTQLFSVEQWEAFFPLDQNLESYLKIVDVHVVRSGNTAFFQYTHVLYLRSKDLEKCSIKKRWSDEE